MGHMAKLFVRLNAVIGFIIVDQTCDSKPYQLVDIELYRDS